MLDLDTPLRRSIQTCALLLVLALAAWPAAAGDGVLEINGTCAVQTGCFPGDDPGFPVTINQRGSYRLTSNLGRLVPQTLNTDFIAISASDVTLDLGGFGISCSSLALGGLCEGAGVGIAAFAPGVRIHNGIVRSMPLHGVRTSTHAVVEKMIVHDNGGHGIQTASFSIVTDNKAYANARRGISINGSAVISGNRADQNGSDGISDASGSLFEGNVATLNGGHGLVLSSTSVYRANVITDNATGQVDGGVNRGDNLCSGPGTGSTSCP